MTQPNNKSVQGTGQVPYNTMVFGKICTGWIRELLDDWLMKWGTLRGDGSVDTKFAALHNKFLSE